MYKEIKNNFFIQLVFFLKPFFRYLDIVYATGSTSFKYLFTSVSRLVCGKRYRGKHLIYSQALNCISCSTVFAAMQVYYCMITLIIFFSFSQQIMCLMYIISVTQTKHKNMLVYSTEFNMTIEY